MTRRAIEIRHGALPRAVAAHGLTGAAARLPDAPLPGKEFDRLVSQVQTQRLTGLLWQAVVDGALLVDEAQAERVEWLHVQSLSGALVLERLLLDTVSVLEAAGIPVRVLKGSALAHLDYPDPSWRTFGDVDLLVRGTDFDHAVQLIQTRGHRRLHPEPRPGFDSRFSKGTSFRTADGLEIDLHRTFTMGPFGVRLDVDALWERSDDFELAGRTLPALRAEERFVHACYHAVLGEVEPRLVPLRDLAQLCLTRDLDLTRVHDLIHASRGEAVVSHAIRHAWAAFDIADATRISAWADAYRVDPREAADLAVYGRGSNYTQKSVAAIRALPTIRDRAAYVYALVAPTRSYLGERHSGRLSRLRTGWGQSARSRRST